MPNNVAPSHYNPQRWMVTMFNHVLLYGCHIDAIRGMLTRHHQVDLALENKIDTLELEAKQLFGLRNEIAVADLMNMYHDSMCQNAVHSMATAGTLAPLFESFFTTAFSEMGKYLKPKESIIQKRIEFFKREDPWDCHFYLSNGNERKNVVLGIKELVEASGMAEFMPPHLNNTLEALFAYRNKMFHCGFSWPPHECDKFEKLMTSWPRSWFEQATCDGKPAEFYMSKTFVDHCIETIDQVVNGVLEYGKSLKEQFNKEVGGNQVKS